MVLQWYYNLKQHRTVLEIRESRLILLKSRRRVFEVDGRFPRIELRAVSGPTDQVAKFLLAAYALVPYDEVDVVFNFRR